NVQGGKGAIVVADTEDQAEDALDVIDVNYEILPFASTVEQSMSPNAPDLRKGRGNLIRISENDPHYAPDATWVAKHGDVNKGFAEAAIIKEFSYYFGGGVSVPMQPCGSVAKWEGE